MGAAVSAPSAPYLAPDFQEALRFDLDAEGRSYEDVPGDLGGPTRAGITFEDGNEWRKARGLAPLTIEQARATRLSYLTTDVIEQIYYAHYWVPMKGADLPDPLDEVLFDAAVNCGTARSVQWLQGVVGAAQDGQFGPETLRQTKAYVAVHGQGQLVNGLFARRQAYYLSRGSWADKFKRGWINRVNNLKAVVKAALAKAGSK